MLASNWLKTTLAAWGWWLHSINQNYLRNRQTERRDRSSPLLTTRIQLRNKNWEIIVCVRTSRRRKCLYCYTEIWYIFLLRVKVYIVSVVLWIMIYQITLGCFSSHYSWVDVKANLVSKDLLVTLTLKGDEKFNYYEWLKFVIRR